MSDLVLAEGCALVESMLKGEPLKQPAGYRRFVRHLLAEYAERAVIRPEGGLFQNLSPYAGSDFESDGTVIESELSYIIRRSFMVMGDWCTGSAYGAEVSATIPYNGNSLKGKFMDMASSLEGFVMVPRADGIFPGMVSYYNRARNVTVRFNDGESGVWYLPAIDVDLTENPLITVKVEWMRAPAVNISVYSGEEMPFRQVVGGFAQYLAQVYNTLEIGRRIDERILQATIQLAIDNERMMPDGRQAFETRLLSKNYAVLK